MINSLLCYDAAISHSIFIIGGWLCDVRYPWTKEIVGTKKKKDGQDNESEDEAIGSVNETIPNGIHMVGVAHITVFDSSFLLWE